MRTLGVRSGDIAGGSTNTGLEPTTCNLKLVGVVDAWVTPTNLRAGIPDKGVEARSGETKKGGGATTFTTFASGGMEPTTCKLLMGAVDARGRLAPMRLRAAIPDEGVDEIWRGGNEKGGSRTGGRGCGVEWRRAEGLLSALGAGRIRPGARWPARVGRGYSGAANPGSGGFWAPAMIGCAVSAEMDAHASTSSRPASVSVAELRPLELGLLVGHSESTDEAR